MKYYSVLVVVTFLFAACTKQTTSTQVLNELPDTSAVLYLKGNFMNGPWGTTSGEARIYKKGSTYQLGLEMFMASNGPDLKVYLSKEVQPITFVNLGSLKSVSGNQLYIIPVNVDFTQYKYALIHCQQYNHLFGSAELKP